MWLRPQHTARASCIPRLRPLLHPSAPWPPGSHARPLRWMHSPARDRPLSWPRPPGAAPAWAVARAQAISIGKNCDKFGIVVPAGSRHRLPGMSTRDPAGKPSRLHMRAGNISQVQTSACPSRVPGQGGGCSLSHHLCSTWYYSPSCAWGPNTPPETSSLGQWQLRDHEIHCQMGAGMVWVCTGLPGAARAIWHFRVGVGEEFGPFSVLPQAFSSLLPSSALCLFCPLKGFSLLSLDYALSSSSCFSLSSLFTALISPQWF